MNVNKSNQVQLREEDMYILIRSILKKSEDAMKILYRDSGLVEATKVYAQTPEAGIDALVTLINTLHVS